MRPLVGSELSRMRAEDLRAQARPEPRRRGGAPLAGPPPGGGRRHLLDARRRVA